MSQPTEEGPGSVSRVLCRVEVRGKGEARVSLFRHLSPLTVNAFLRILPIESRVNLQRAMVSLFADVRVGVEKPRASFERGDIAFLASGGLLCVFLGSATSGRPLNPVGKVEAGMELFDSLRLGDVVRLSQDEQ